MQLGRNNKMTDSTSFKRALFSIWSWLCLFYALLIISFGISIPLVSGWDIARNSEALTEYISFLVVIYAISIIFFVIYHYNVGNYGKLIKWISKRSRDFKNFLKGCIYQRRYRLYDASGQNNSNAFKSFLESEELEEGEEHSDKIGKHGLKLAVKVSSIVIIIMIIVQLSYYVQARRKLAKDCELDEKGAMILLMFFYVLLQAHFLLTASKEHFEATSLFIQFGCAHLTGTTISTGFFLTLHDDVLKLYPLYKRVREAANFPEILTVDDSSSKESHEEISIIRKRRSVPAVAVNVSNPCSLSSYIVSNESQLKPFTFQLSMFYVYSCSIILVLLFLHLRKIILSSNNLTKNQMVSLFKSASKRGATFSTSAGLSLIILAIIASLLSMNENIYAMAFLIFLHTQATCVGLVALCKIAYVPCFWKRQNGSKNHVIFLCFYFMVMISVSLKIISNKITEEPHEEYETVIEMAETSLDLIQLFLQGLLILIGFFVDVAPGVLHRRIMPCEILIHLAATNLSDLIANIFRKHTYDYFAFIKQEERHNEMASHHSNGPSESEILAMQIPSTIMGSVLLPCISFHRFYSIICLIKLHKVWSPDEHSKQTKIKCTNVKESQF